MPKNTYRIAHPLTGTLGRGFDRFADSFMRSFGKRVDLRSGACIAGAVAMRDCLEAIGVPARVIGVTCVVLREGHQPAFIGEPDDRKPRDNTRFAGHVVTLAGESLLIDPSLAQAHRDRFPEMPHLMAGWCAAAPRLAPGMTAEDWRVRLLEASNKHGVEIRYYYRDDTPDWSQTPDANSARWAGIVTSIRDRYAGQPFAAELARACAEVQLPEPARERPATGETP